MNNVRDDYKLDNVDILWRNITVKDGDHFLLSDCCGRALSSKITAIFGSIGSGKTTLVKTLTGRLDKGLMTSGSVLLDNKIKKSNSWIHTIAFVDNSFDFQAFQTVYETVYFSVKFLEIDCNEQTIKKKTEDLINTVGLYDLKLENITSMSDGERRLLSVAVALAEDPSVLILDDPFASLDICHIKNLLKLFRKLTENKKTIIFTFKYSNHNLINYIDYLVLLIRGTTIFEGTYSDCQKHFERCGFINTEKMPFFEFIYSVVVSDYHNEDEKIVSMQNARKIKDKWVDTRDNTYRPCTPLEIEELPRGSLVKTKLLLKRLFITTYRNKELFYGLCIQKLFLFVAAALVYPRIGFKQADIPTRIGIVSFFILNATERSGTVIMSTFADYRKVTIREIYSGFYTPSEAYYSKFLYNSALGFIFSVIYIIPVYWLANVNNNFGRFTLFIINQFTLTNFIVAYSIVIGIYTRNHLSAHIQGSLLLMFFIVFSGIFVNIKTIRLYVRWITWTSPMYYAYESNLQVSMSNLKFTCDDDTCLSTGQEVIKDLGVNRIHFFPALVIQWAIILLFILVGRHSYVRKYKPKIIQEKNSLLNNFN